VVQEIRLTQRIEAPRKLLWSACSEPRGLANWQADEVSGSAKLGGVLQLTWAALDAKAELSVIERVTGESIAFEQENGRVRLELGEGQVTLTHEGFDPEQDVAGLTSSWRVALAQLAHAVERHPGRSRRVQWRLRPMTTSPELVHLALTEPFLCNRWLATAGRIGEPGSNYGLLLFDGQLLSGRVLANSAGRDVALSCDEAGEATLILRTFPGGAADERLVALAWSEWGAPSRLGNQYLTRLEQGLERLQRVVEAVGIA
jgi:uncharacterized protein YndB with AHSA1/START domain